VTTAGGGAVEAVSCVLIVDDGWLHPASNAVATINAEPATRRNRGIAWVIFRLRG
jgi:hypothetical protein